MSKPSLFGALAALSLPMLLSSLGTSVANVGLPAMAESLGASFRQAQWIVLAYLLAVTALIVGTGRLGDLVGRRRLLLAGIALFGATSLLCGSASSLGLLIGARAVQGIGAAVMMALSMALVGESVPEGRTGRAIGLIGTMSAIGTALGPSLGGFLIAGFGWRAIFLVNLPIAAAAFLLALRCLPLDRDRQAGRRGGFDMLGTGLLALTLAAYALAMTAAPGGLGPSTLALFLAAVVGAGLFVRSQRAAESPLIRPEMLRDPRLSSSLAMSALVATVMMTTLVTGPFYLSLGLGLDSIAAGLALSAGPLVAAATGFPAGRLADRLGAERVASAGLLAMVAGCILLSLLPQSLGTAGYVAPMALVTAGYALFQTANNTAVMAGVPADRRGLVSGLLNLSRNLGLVTGASAMGALFAAGSGGDDIASAGSEAVADAMRATFAAAAVLIGAAIAVESVGRGRRAEAAAARPRNAPRADSKA